MKEFQNEMQTGLSDSPQTVVEQQRVLTESKGPKLADFFLKTDLSSEVSQLHTVLFWVVREAFFIQYNLGLLSNAY